MMSFGYRYGSVLYALALPDQRRDRFACPSLTLP